MQKEYINQDEYLFGPYRTEIERLKKQLYIAYFVLEEYANAGFYMHGISDLKIEEIRSVAVEALSKIGLVK